PAPHAVLSADLQPAMTFASCRYLALNANSATIKYDYGNSTVGRQFNVRYRSATNLIPPEVMDGELAVRIGPSIERSEAGAGGQCAEFGDCVFVGILGVDHFACAERKALPGNDHGLLAL